MRLWVRLPAASMEVRRAQLAVVEQLDVEQHRVQVAAEQHQAQLAEAVGQHQEVQLAVEQHRVQLAVEQHQAQLAEAVEQHQVQLVEAVELADAVVPASTDALVTECEFASHHCEAAMALCAIV